MTREEFGQLVEEQLKWLPDRASALLQNVGLLVEERPAEGPSREADYSAGLMPGVKHLSQYWGLFPKHLATPPLATMTLYMEPILSRGDEPAAAIRNAILRTLEKEQHFDEGSLDRDDEDDDSDADILPVEDSPEMLVEMAEAEIQALPAEMRDWFENMEISSVDEPEAKGDPRRLADFPSHGDETPMLVFYARNIRRRGEPAPTTVRHLLREAWERRT